MTHRILRAAIVLVLLSPAAALAQHFEAVDNIPWPRLGRYPAYPPEPPRDTEIYARAGAVHDNNLFRLSPDANRQAILGTNDGSDDVYRVGAGIRHEMRIAGRQSIRLEARGDELKYSNFSQLDHFEYGLRGEWLWEVTNDVNGALGYERRTRLIDLAQVQAPVKDIIVEDHGFLNGAWRIGPSMRLRGALDALRGSHSDNTLAAGDSHALTGTLGVDYVTALGNSLGVEYRQTHANYPTQELTGGGTLVDNEYTEREIAGVLGLVAGPTVTGNVRVGHTSRKHKEFPERDFSGTTWRGTLDWTPLQKTGLEFSLYHEPRSIIDIAASYVLVSGGTFGPRWAPTEKLVFYAFAVRERQQFKGDPNLVLVPGTVQRDETVRALRVGGGWELQRFVNLSLGVDHGQRTSNTFLRDYTYTTVMANAEFRF
jgi:hypothetical protein